MAVGFLIKGAKRDIIVIADTLKDAENEFRKHEKDIKKYSRDTDVFSSSDTKKTESKLTISNLILGLKTEKFFDSPKNWNDIQKALEEQGYTYPLRSLTQPLQQLVRKRELGRIKKNDKWHYVKR